MTAASTRAIPRFVPFSLVATIGVGASVVALRADPDTPTATISQAMHALAGPVGALADSLAGHPGPTPASGRGDAAATRRPLVTTGGAATPDVPSAGDFELPTTAMLRTAVPAAGGEIGDPLPARAPQPPHHPDGNRAHEVVTSPRANLTARHHGSRHHGLRHAPDITAPDITAPDITAPDITAPDITAPSTTDEPRTAARHHETTG